MLDVADYNTHSIALKHLVGVPPVFLGLVLNQVEKWAVGKGAESPSCSHVAL